jgi:hypothetical protein
MASWAAGREGEAKFSWERAFAVKCNWCGPASVGQVSRRWAWEDRSPRSKAAFGSPYGGRQRTPATVPREPEARSQAREHRTGNHSAVIDML